MTRKRIDRPVSYQTALTVYRKGLEEVLKNLSVLNCDQVHGSEVNSWVIDCYSGNCIGESATTEKILRALVDVDVLTPLQASPNISQKAFSGLAYSKRGYRDTVSNFHTAYGLQTHYWFRVNSESWYLLV
jgi:hypothetical protein